MNGEIKMSSLEVLVRDIMSDFVNSAKPFTALDISNVVKETLPSTRYSEVREIVKQNFTSMLVPLNWTKSIITVNLGNGGLAEAWLYHSLSDTWDLDTKYDVLKRAQTSKKIVPMTVGDSNVVPMTVANDKVIPMTVNDYNVALPTTDKAKKDNSNLSDEDYNLIYSAVKDDLGLNDVNVGHSGGCCDHKVSNVSLFEEISKDLDSVKKNLNQNKQTLIGSFKKFLFNLKKEAE